MPGASVAQEIFAALGEVAQELGNGVFTGILLRPDARENPWDDATDDPLGIEVRIMVEHFDQHHVDGTLIRSGDKRVMMDATGPVPSPADRLRIGDSEFSIVSVETIAPAGVALSHSLHCRA